MSRLEGLKEHKFLVGSYICMSLLDVMSTWASLISGNRECNPVLLAVGADTIGEIAIAKVVGSLVCLVCLTVANKVSWLIVIVVALFCVSVSNTIMAMIASGCAW